MGWNRVQTQQKHLKKKLNKKRKSTGKPVLKPKKLLVEEY